VPPRFTYWTIIFGGQPTSFRSGTRDELVPTFKQIQARHPDAQLRYFARGKLWYSEEEAQAALIRERVEKRERRRPTGPKPRPGQWKPRDDRRPPRPGGWTPAAGSRKPEAGSDHRGRGWRPGGAHKDPRAQFKVPRDVKRARMAKKFGWKKKKDEE
jgi:hypothetical protein